MKRKYAAIDPYDGFTLILNIGGGSREKVQSPRSPEAGASTQPQLALQLASSLSLLKIRDHADCVIFFSVFL